MFFFSAIVCLTAAQRNPLVALAGDDTEIFFKGFAEMAKARIADGIGRLRHIKLSLPNQLAGGFHASAMQILKGSDAINRFKALIELATAHPDRS